MLDNVNAHLASPHFKMTHMKSELQSVAAPGGILNQMAEDLKGAFYRLLFAIQSRKYCGFHWRGVFYRALAMVVGWTLPPVRFTKTVRAWTTALYAIGSGNGETCLGEDQGEGQLACKCATRGEDRGPHSRQMDSLEYG